MATTNKLTAFEACQKFYTNGLSFTNISSNDISVLISLTKEEIAKYNEYIATSCKGTLFDSPLEWVGSIEINYTNPIGVEKFFMRVNDLGCHEVRDCISFDSHNISLGTARLNKAQNQVFVDTFSRWVDYLVESK